MMTPLIWRLLDESCGYGTEARHNLTKPTLGCGERRWKDSEVWGMAVRAGPSHAYLGYFISLSPHQVSAACASEVSWSPRASVLQSRTSFFSSCLLQKWEVGVARSGPFPSCERP